ncbi:MAG: lytic transglycosylase domain-containing protein [Alphaproteobacteria bacterium]
MSVNIQANAYENPTNRKQTSKARTLTVQAIQDIEKERWSAGKQKIAQSKDPLASKIYHWLLLTNVKKSDWTNQLFIRLSHFIRQNAEWPGISKMVVRAEGVMPEGLSNAEVITWYDDFAPQTPYGMQRYMDAMIIEGHKREAREFFASWWGNIVTSRDQQKRIYKKYRAYVTPQAHKKRLDTLLHKKNYDNARAIASLLGKGYPKLVEARIALAKNNGSGVGKLIDNVPKHLQNDSGLLYQRLRWRRKRDLNKGALEILAQVPSPEKVYNKKEWWTERHIMIRRLLEQKRHKEAYFLASKHIQEEGFSYAQAQWLAGWMALRFMKRPTEAYERFTVLYHKVKTPVSKARASYWAGRAAQALGQHDMAQSWYKKAAEFQTVFYGQLAGAALSMQNKLPKGKLPKVSKSEVHAYQKNELVQASFLFKSAGMRDVSENFMFAFLSKDGTPKAYRFAAEITAKGGDFYGAIKIAKKAASQGMFLTKQSYPTITKQLRHIDIVEWALVHAIIRQESMFDYKATSHAGAKGLMQLMPATAREVSKKVGVGYKYSWLTSKPRYNMLLGSSYIASLIDRYDGNYAMAIAAYNAGPGRVDSWVKKYGDPRKNQISLIDWIELIPIYETRNYVQRVLEGVYIYRLRLENIQKQPKQPIHIAIHSIP